MPVVTKDLPISSRFSPMTFFYRDVSSALSYYNSSTNNNNNKHGWILLTTTKYSISTLTSSRLPLRVRKEPESKKLSCENRTHESLPPVLIVKLRCLQNLIHFSIMFCMFFVCISLTADGPQRATSPIPPTATLPSPSC